MRRMLVGGGLEVENDARPQMVRWLAALGDGPRQTFALMTVLRSGDFGVDFITMAVNHLHVVRRRLLS